MKAMKGKDETDAASHLAIGKLQEDLCKVQNRETSKSACYYGMSPTIVSLLPPTSEAANWQSLSRDLIYPGIR